MPENKERTAAIELARKAQWIADATAREWHSDELLGGWAWVGADGVAWARLCWIDEQYEWSAGWRRGHAKKFEDARREAEVAARKL